MDKDEVKYVRSGKDTCERSDPFGMISLAQAYVQYMGYDTEVKVGRQIFEGFLTKSNDTAMIPNTFEGYSLVNKSLPDTTITLGYFSRQKLRGHTKFHDVIAYDGWHENDDVVAHKGLTKNRLEAAGIDTALIVAGIRNKSMHHLALAFWYTGVPELIYSIMAEANYEISLPDGWHLTPGFRYMVQVDDGVGEIGGAGLSGKVSNANPCGYNDPDSADGNLYGVRLVLRKGAGGLQAGYSSVSDDADLVAPWRGFPTGGYACSIAPYNWEANTRSWMVKAVYDFSKAGILKGLRAGIDYVNMDYDEKKETLGGHSRTDRISIHGDLRYRFPPVLPLETRVRLGVIEADKDSDGTDPSYNEYRLDFNYLF